MKTILTVIKHEFTTAVFRRSFLIMLLMVPLVGFGVMLFSAYANGEGQGSAVGTMFSTEQEPTIDGYIDHSGLIEALPSNLEDTLVPFADEAAAIEGIRSGEINGYYIIPTDYLQTGKLEYVQSDYSPFAGLESSATIEDAINFNLLGHDQTLADRVNEPWSLQTRLLSGQTERDPNAGLTFFLPYIVTFLFYFIIFGSASLMLNNLTSEKQNRMIEILMTSVSPMQLITGKIIALGLVGLLQTIVWSVSGLLMLRLGGTTLQIGEAFQLDPSIIFWGVLFFIGGYAIYASFMAGVGALVPSLKEASQATFVVMIPLIIPMMLIQPLISKPNGTLSIFFSMFPLTSPVSMMTRLSATQVPLWQILMALALVFLAAYLVVRAVAVLFRAQNLLVGQKFTMGKMIEAMRARAS